MFDAHMRVLGLEGGFSQCIRPILHREPAAMLLIATRRSLLLNGGGYSSYWALTNVMSKHSVAKGGTMTSPAAFRSPSLP